MSHRDKQKALHGDKPGQAQNNARSEVERERAAKPAKIIEDAAKNAKAGGKYGKGPNRKEKNR